MEERKLASIRKIAEIKDIPNSDFLSAYRVDGWWVVDHKDKYKLHSLVAYLEVDSWVPYSVAPFLSKEKEPRVYKGVRGERLRTIKLRGQISQGLVLPLNEELVDFQEGQDCTEYLGVLKWEAPVHPTLAGQVRRYFPTFLKKTDQERAQNLLREIFENREGTLYEVTMKLDGSSITVYNNSGDMGVCSRNLDLKLNEENTENTFIKTARSIGLFDAVQTLGRNIAVQGELMGPGIQGNKEKLEQHDIYIFDIWDIDNHKYLPSYERMKVLQELRECGASELKHVPLMTYGLPIDAQGVDIDCLLAWVNQRSMNNDIAEGFVWKSIDGDFSFKCINNQFLLKYGE